MGSKPTNPVLKGKPMQSEPQTIEAIDDDTLMAILNRERVSDKRTMDDAGEYLRAMDTFDDMTD